MLKNTNTLLVERQASTIRVVIFHLSEKVSRKLFKPSLKARLNLTIICQLGYPGQIWMTHLTQKNCSICVNCAYQICPG